MLLIKTFEAVLKAERRVGPLADSAGAGAVHDDQAEDEQADGDADHPLGPKARGLIDKDDCTVKQIHRLHGFLINEVVRGIVESRHRVHVVKQMLFAAELTSPCRFVVDHYICAACIGCARIDANGREARLRKAAARQLRVCEHLAFQSFQLTFGCGHIELGPVKERPPRVG